jgi:gluconokinase
MGVVGAGKTTVGRLLAQKLGWQFADADDFHSNANKTKIARGIPLTDSDREPWLAALHSAMERWNAEGQNAVLACSALKERYREQLQAGPVRFIYLKGNPELIAARLHSRRGHYATDAILQSQFADLEEPHAATTVTIDKSPEEIVTEIIDRLKAAQVVS